MNALRNAFLSILVIACAAACERRPDVMVNGEVLRGDIVENGNVAAFLGVPFAAPPVGDLRWRGPQPYRGSGGNRDARNFAPACMQSQRIVEWYRDKAELFGSSRDVIADVPVSEDCLYLNIWTPEPEMDMTLPVMVYVHGGSNRSGWSWEPNYHGNALAAEGVVVVSIAYRVGDFGFFAHPDIREDTALANFGLWDQVAALRWIRENIASFGGDPERVTLFGESSGAENIVALMFSRFTDDLFAQAILQSTAAFGLLPMRTLADEQRRGAALSTQLGGGQPLDIAEMRALPAAELLRLSEENLQGHYHSPIVDGILLDGSVGEIIASGEFRRRNLIVGTNADEWYATIDRDADDEDLQVHARRFFPGNHAEALEQVSGETDIRTQIDRIHTAGAMLCPSQYFASLVSSRRNPAWMYWFSRARDGRAGEEWRAYHGIELPYVFGTHDEWMNATDADLRVTDSIMSYWLQFARYGDPNSIATDVWPVYKAPDFFVQNINDPVTTISRPEAGLCDLYVRELR